MRIDWRINCRWAICWYKT